jgi:hypothetical protein
MDQNYNVPHGELATQVQAAQSASQELSRRQTNGSKKKKYFIFFAVFTFAAIGIYLIVKGLSSHEDVVVTASPTPTISGVQATPAALPSEEPASELDRKGVDIEVLNGTGISGEAGFLETKLEALGYSDITAKNATSQDNDEALVSFSSTLDEGIVSEITDLLKDVYKDVSTKTSSSLSTDVQITTGLRSGQTALPKNSPEASATSTPSPSPSATPQ